jgi:NAD(P)-dependent dehydrogenase (short-subunit alcohol dehydrogenase family)
MNRLKNKVAIITGGTSGIGEATAEVFAEQGCKVVIAGRSEDKGANIADRLGSNVLYKQADVMKENEIKSIIDFAVSTFGKLDILFNNAGAATRTDLESVTQEIFHHDVQLLLGSVIFGIKHAIAPLKANGGGVIINNASIAGIRYGQGTLLYSAVKAAVAHYTKLAGVELGPHNIRVNCISPGAIATPIFWGGSERANTLSAEENAQKMQKLQNNLAKATPIPSSGEARDIANGALFLASDEGRYVNSHDLVIDGGRIAMFNEKM